MKATITLFLALCWAGLANAQPWNRISTLPQAEFTALEVIDGTIFTAVSGKLLYSNNPENGWQQASITGQPITVNCFAKYQERLYAGTSHGIFSVAFGQFQNTWSHDIGTIDVTSFMQKDNMLYASTMGFGIYRKNGNSNFNYFSSGLPNYSFNVSRIVDAPAGMIAMAGGNGTFYKYDWAHDRWDEDYYYTGYSPGMQIDDALRVGHTVYASRFNQLLRTDDSGENWTQDQIGLQNGHNRFLYAGQQMLYVLTTVFTGEANLTFLQKREKNAASQTAFTTSEVLPFYTYGLREFGDRLYAAGHDGLYTNGTTLGNFSPDAKAQQIFAYPNPSADGRFTIKSRQPMMKIEIYDAAGHPVQSLENIGLEGEIQVLSAGLYLLRATTADAVQTLKVVSH